MLMILKTAHGSIARGVTAFWKYLFLSKWVNSYLFNGMSRKLIHY